ncbi:MAG: tyrosine-type recombinase/integrase [Butyribacter sp.]|uniref:tyrosine-type recombinase/integrase n=1 Tax=Butyribacter sp. TaxID=2822465 RepID=UPI0039A06066
MTDREQLFNDLCVLISDDDLRNRIYIMLDKYEITQRETSIALLEEDRNEYLLKRFIVGKTVKGCTKRTLQFYKSSVSFIFGYIGKTVDDITTEDIRLYMAKRLYQDKVSKTTVGNEIRCLSSFFAYICAEELMPKNPMLRIDRIKKEKTKKEAFTELELEKMRTQLRTKREKAIFEILLSTGCRVTELAKIRLAEINGDEILVHGKGEKDRTVYLNAKGQWALKEYLEERKDNSMYLFPGGYFAKSTPKGKHGHRREWYKYPEFVNELKAINTGAIEAMIRKIGRKVGVKAYPHKFRRTCATFALRRGMPIEQVSKMLGHESIETTQIYLDLSEKDLKAAHDKYVI